MSESYRHSGYVGRPADSKERAEQNRRLAERLRQEVLDRESERERSRLSDIEARKRWEATYAAMNLDDIIEIPGRHEGKDIMLRFHERGGRLFSSKV
jgi:hypothetical protein